MNRIVNVTAVALAMAMLVPPGAATWASYGGVEPSSTFDHTFLFDNAPGTSTNRVYFNTYSVQGPAGLASPNSATLGSRIEDGPVYSAFNAILGAWTDCNQDGYVGLADGALLEYRAEASALAGFPVNLNLCPVLPDDAAHRTHNNGNWITELLPIAPVTADDEAANNNWRAIPDSTVKIWGDFGVPVTPASAPPPSDDCSSASVVPPFGKGDTGHTGGVLQHLDCLDGNLPWHAWALVASQDPTGTLAGVPVAGLRDLYQNGGLLDINLLGTDQSCKDGQDVSEADCQGGSNSIVSGEQDCSQQPVVVTDPATGTPAEGTPADPGDTSLIRLPGQPSVNPSGSVAATANETIEETPLLDDCDTTDDSGHDVYGNGITESGGAGGIKAVGKSAAQMNFGWGGLTFRETCDDSTVGGDPVPTVDIPDGQAKCGMPDDAGAHSSFLTAEILAGSGTWWSGTNWLGRTPAVGAPGVDRATLTVTPDTFRSAWTTFYASVGVSGVALPGGSAQYGAPWCTAGIGRNAGIQNGWDCDPSHWYLDPQTGQQSAGVARLGVVGNVYNTRDVDCYDSTLVGKGSSLNPTGQDLGPRAIPLISQPTSGCS